MDTHSQRTLKTLGDVCAFLIPCLVFVEIQLVGRLFLPELVLLVMFPFLLRGNGRLLLSGFPKTLITLGLFWFASQILTDLIRATPFHDFARGWANIVFFLIAFCSIYMLIINSERRVFLFALGIIVGQVLEYFLAPNIYAVGGDYWKFGVGYAITFLLVIGTQSRLVSKVTYFPELILIAATLLNWGFGFRSLGAICFMVVVYLCAVKFIQSSHLKIVKIGINKKILLILAMLIGGVADIKVYGVLANSGMLGGLAQQLYKSQAGGQAEGQAGILIGGRQEMLVSTLAISDSPIIGHGSWAHDRDYKYHTLLRELLLKYGYGKALPITYDTEHIPTHSFLMGAWVHSGLLGAIFWIWVLVFLTKVFLIIPTKPDLLAPMFAFVCIALLWNVLFSPFGAETRMYTAFYLVLLMFMQGRFSKNELVVA